MQYHFCVHIEKSQRVDMYVSALFGHLSRSYVQKLVDSGCIQVNGKKVKKNIKVAAGDEISIQEIISSGEVLPENIPLEIIYEDENFLLVNKDSGINVHPTPGIQGNSGTLVNAVLFYCKEKLPIISGEQRPGIVHRLDKDTSGAILIAKNDKMMHYFSDIIKSRKIKKYYIAVVVGMLQEKSFTLESEIGRDPYERTKMTVYNPINPKKAITHVQVLGYFENKYTIIKVDLQTGRTHQIRVHLASFGYPILGDKVYGNFDENVDAQAHYDIRRQQLHAYALQFELYGERKTFIAKVKSDMTQFLEKINISL